MIILLKNLTDNFIFILVMAFIISNLPLFKNIFRKDEYRKRDIIILTILFGGFGIVGTYAGTEINGAIANTRIVGVMAGGILFGPVVGIFAGIIAGFHRLFIDFGGITSVPCTITTITAGFVSAYIYKKAVEDNKKFYGLIGGILVESLEMILILLLSKPYSSALSIVKSIYLPMSLTNGIGIFLLIVLIQNYFKEKDKIAAEQAKLALEIASKTLPYFRDITADSNDKICQIIKDSTGAAAVSITDKNTILSHVGLGSDHHIKGNSLMNEGTKKAIREGIVIALNSPEEIGCPEPLCPLKSAIIAPLKEGDEVIGALKIFYAKKNAVTFRTTNLVIGLSQLISTQYEISKVNKLKDMAAKAELKALQAQINPHFLFNAFNTIISFLRYDPNKARSLIINLTSYLRYNLDYSNSYVELSRELDQVKTYLEVEKARFGDNLNVIFNIAENIDMKVPSLIIQPIVENAIRHGIKGAGTIIVSAYPIENGEIYISVEDDGVGINEDIIEKVYKGIMKESKIGITNVNNRLKNLYGKGLNIERLKKGTKISFTVHAIRE
ncbi:MAG: sensor histidine kinase [Bacillota bacterium]|nr:sensor histidine kinase [Bacillota bacterium]